MAPTVGIPAKALWRAVVSRMLTFAGVFSPEGLVIEVGRVLLRATGLKAQEVIGRHWADIPCWTYSPAVREEIRSGLSCAVRGNTARREVSLCGPDGLPWSVELVFTSVCDAAGRVIAIEATGIDISARKKAEANLRQSNRDLLLFRRLLDRTNDLVYLADAATGQLVDANDTAARKLGLSRKALLRMSVTDFSSAARGQPWSERLAAVKRTGSLMVEETYQGKDARQFPVETSWSYVEDPKHPLLIAVARDITERKAHEEQIASLTRVLRMQSSINSAVLRLRDRDELLREACRVATDVGGYDHAVLLAVDADGRQARALFSSGKELASEDYRPLELSDGSEPDTSLTSWALRTGELTTCDDLLIGSETPVARRERLLHLGARSVVILPLIAGGCRLGALVLASGRVNHVRGDEILLLQEIRASLELALEIRERETSGAYHTYFDPLTGIANRSLFCERLKPMLIGRTDPHAEITVAAFDVHGLTSINDSFGRRIGDLVLQRVAERLRKNVDSDRIGYLGGGTFTIVVPGSNVSAENLAAMLQSAVFGEAFEIEGRRIHVSCRSGMARHPLDGDRPDALVQHAEAALKRAKETGEQYLHYELQMHGEVAERLALEHKLRTALDEQQFVLHYQPQINIATGRLDSIEALLRWNDPDSGLNLPARFLPVLESSGMIVPVGTWVLERAARDLRRLRSLGLGPLRVAVNVSAVQLRRRNFVEVALQIADGLNDHGYGLDLEITETCLLQDVDAISHKLRTLREAGIRIALDDFGAGYASLGLVSKLPLDLLKIDRSFIQGLGRDPRSASLVSSIMQLAAAFDLSTIAEGVETPEQLAQLRRLNCTHSQGYLHSRAVPIEEIERLLKARTGPPVPCAVAAAEA